MDDTRVATHSAVCGHSACELCWASWSSERCMVCQSLLVGGVTRAPFDVVPRTLRECTREPTDTLESAFNKAIAELVEMKQKLKSIVAELRTALKHLREGAEQGERETQAAVMAIGTQQIAEQLQHLHTLLAGDCRWKAHLAEVVQEMEHLGEEHKLHGPDATIMALPAASIERIRALLQPHTTGGSEKEAPDAVCRVWTGQWAVISELQQELFQGLIPQALAAISASLDDDSVVQAVSLVSALEAAWGTAAASVEDMIEKVESASALLLEQAHPATEVPME